MGIFNIAEGNKISEVKKEDKTSDMDKPLVDDKTTEKDTSNNPLETILGTHISGSSSDTIDNLPDINKKSAQKVIVLDGPLSHIYTQALNQVYKKYDENDPEIEVTTTSNEGFGQLLTSPITFIKSLNKQVKDNYVNTEENENNSNNSLYVYCCDGDSLKTDDSIEVSNKLRLALDSKKYKQVILAIEHNSTSLVSNKLSLVIDFTKALGIEHYDNKDLLLESVISFLKA